LFHLLVLSEVSTLSLHDALPISCMLRNPRRVMSDFMMASFQSARPRPSIDQACSTTPLRVPKQTSYRLTVVQQCPGVSCSWSPRSEEHTSELQSLRHLVCRLLLE